MSLMPLYEKIVVKLQNKQEVKSATGLTYTKNMGISANSTMIADVVAVGEGRLLTDGTLVPLKVKVGDQIIFSKMQGESYNDGTDDFTILSEQSVLAIIKEDNNENN